MRGRYGKNISSNQDINGRVGLLFSESKVLRLKKILLFSQVAWENHSLEEVMQREWTEGRSTKDMARFLSQKDDRFYGAVVVASIKLKDLIWNPIELSPEKLASLVEGEHDPETPSEDKLGYVTLSDEDEYYILDGQHRVGSIIKVLEDGEAY